VSLRLERGDIVGILGANGSGKSTLIRLVSGLLTLDEGRVEVFGHDIERDEMAVKRPDQPGQRRRRLLQEAQPDGEPPVRRPAYGLDAAGARKDAVEILGRLGIGEKRVGRPIEQMSRGMQQKVAIARALLTSPSLLLLDEPTTGLDPRSKLDVQTFIEELRETHDASIVLTTHDLDEAERLCGSITVLAGGRVVVEDSPAGLIAAEAQRPVARDPPRRLHDPYRPLARRRRRGRRSGDDDSE
jgi:ABC-2 type transport system ATP-binding protein